MDELEVLRRTQLPNVHDLDAGHGPRAVRFLTAMVIDAVELTGEGNVAPTHWPSDGQKLV